MEIIVGIVLGIFALSLVACGTWLMEGWMDTNSIGLILVLLVFAIIFVGFGFLAFVGLGALVVTLFGFIGGGGE